MAVSASRVITRALRGALEIPSRWIARTSPPVVELEQVRRRLELLLAALYGRLLPIEVADPPGEAGWFRRYVLHASGPRAASNAVPRTDGDRILLPRALDASSGDQSAIARYRLLALQQAERIVRGTVTHHPGPDAHPLVRELYVLMESVAIEAKLARTVGGIRPILEAARAASLARRAKLPYIGSARRRVERLVRAALGGASNTTYQELAAPARSPEESLVWARDAAGKIGLRGRYEPVRPVAHWGTVNPPPERDADDRTPVIDEVSRSLLPSNIPSPGVEAYGGSGDADGAKLAPTTSGGATSEQQTGDNDAPSRLARGLGTSESGMPLADDDASTLSRDSETAADDYEPWNQPALYREARSDTPAAPGQQYAEWDHVTGRYRERAVTVYGARVTAGDATWASDFLREHSALVRGVRQRFERLKARRVRYRQQPDGDELDLAACVRAMVDWRVGHSSDERLYLATRATRHPLAIALLVDVSGSTESGVNETLRMIDVEKMALLLASEALSALEDRYAILTFTGHGPHGVRVDTVKEFGEANGKLVRRRIATLGPGGFTRLGAAVRHASALLSREQARHRLLLILSDGRPNDLGHYMADYGVEDSRQAIHETRALGIYPFCLNVDHEGPEYLARIFGPSGYATIRRPDQLPLALLGAVRSLIAS